MWAWILAGQQGSRQVPLPLHTALQGQVTLLSPDSQGEGPGSEAESLLRWTRLGEHLGSVGAVPGSSWLQTKGPRNFGKGRRWGRGQVRSTAKMPKAEEGQTTHLGHPRVEVHRSRCVVAGWALGSPGP